MRTWPIDRSPAGLLGLVLTLIPQSTLAQHQHEEGSEQPREHVEMHRPTAHEMEMTGPLGISLTREGSGTSWLPDTTPMAAIHGKLGGWQLMFHDNIFVGYNAQGRSRGDEQVTSTNWIMLMASHDLLGGRFTGRTMLSLEPLTLGKTGYPLLLQSGETANGEPLHDRQHPHDLFMEVAAMYERELAGGIGFQLYGGPAGEPALGPTAFPHRRSAMADPLGPISHHWLDSTHISFGVVTAGLFTRHVKIEGSWFNGREPDEDRYNFDLRPFDSYATRVTINPVSSISLQGSYGFLESPEQLNPEESLHRVTASVIHDVPIGGEGNLATTLAWGRNVSPDHADTDAILLESAAELDMHHTVFGRGEYVRKSAHDLVVDDESEDRVFDVGQATLGYSYSFGALARMVPSIGVRGSVGFVPDALEDEYGSNTPLGGMVFMQIAPERMNMH